MVGSIQTLFKVKTVYKIISPLRVLKNSKDLWTLNLNIYRNTHYHTLNNAKINYKKAVKSQIDKLPKMGMVCIHYKVFPKTAKKFDLGNVVSVHKKFIEDALVELKKIPDDDYLTIVRSTESFGSIDKHNPRVEILIFPIEEKNGHYFKR